MTPVAKGNEAEGNDDQQYSLFVYMPPKKEGSIPTKSDGANKSFPTWQCRRKEELEERQNLEDECQDETCPGRYFGQDCECSISYKPAGDAV